MYIYNVTVAIEEHIHKAWLKWMKEEHLPEMLATGKFTHAKLLKVLVENDSGITYSVQYITPDRDCLEKYYQEDAVALRRKGIERFGDAIIAFRTELEVIVEFRAPDQD